MRSFTILLIAIIAIGTASHVSAQEEFSHLGTWKLVEIEAVDSMGNVLVDETAVLVDGMIDSTTVEYQITEFTFTLLIDGEIIGSCEYYLAPVPGTAHAYFVFDEAGSTVEEYVRNMRGKEVTATNLYVDSDSPDIDAGVIYREVLERQP